MNELETIHIFAEDISPPDTWRLLEWCHDQGANEFGLTCMGFDETIEDFAAAFDLMFGPFKLKPGRREVLTAPTAEDFVRETELWQLNMTTMRCLRNALPGGIFMYEMDGLGWYEDLYVYRDGAFMMGVVTHEQEGLIRLTLEQNEIFDKIGIKYRNKAEWI